MNITLYESAQSRSGRATWTLEEVGLPYEKRSGMNLVGSDELKKVHPLGKLPALIVDGRPLFESAAIATWIADHKPEAGLAHRVGSWDRALHDQWVAFALTEMEAYLWNNLRNNERFPLVPPGGKVPAIKAQGDTWFTQAAKVLDDALAGKSFLVADRFSVTDIIVSFTANWGRNAGLSKDFANILRWLDGLYQRPHCTLARPKAA